MSESTVALRSRPRQRLALIGLFAIFFVPIVIAWWMNLHPDYWRPSATVNHGTLVVPPRPVPDGGLRHLDGTAYGVDFFRSHWTLALVDGAACEDACARQLVKMRQARLALGKEMDRVRRLYVFSEMPTPGRLAELQQAHPGLSIARVNQGWLASFQLDRDTANRSGGIYLVDPDGRVMMYYDEEAAAEGILKDLQRLLKISKIG